MADIYSHYANNLRNYCKKLHFWFICFLRIFLFFFSVYQTLLFIVPDIPFFVVVDFEQVNISLHPECIEILITKHELKLYLIFFFAIKRRRDF